MIAKDYRLEARNALKGFWVMSILIALIAMLLGGVEPGSSNNSNNNGNSSQVMTESFNDFRDGNIRGAATSVVATAVGILFGTTMLIILIVRFVVGSVVELGYNMYNIKLVNRQEQKGVETLFGHRAYFGNAIVLRFLKGLFIFLWSLLFIIPGVIAAYRYSMATYIMSENPDISPMEALERSKEMMDGRKWSLFCLRFSFIGWRILAGIFTFGIGNLVVVPYEKTAEAAFYLNNTGRLRSPGIVQ